ncbi:attachment protein [Pseudomonas aeruginosa]|uniref:attachment protein n=2 Tax=Pseudomonas TaxID=286 RepID=UPI0015F0781D|nr:attachment protein [Pseudomonas aeruginosa]MBA5093970.1 attachment protein [Pseudomonas aeruginosa]MBA5093980.1 attachment protein [Pseudomonas aeruginosa]
MRRLLLLLVLVSSSVSAEEYYWYMGYFDKKVSSPSAGCDLYFTGISRDPGRVFVMEPSSNPSEAGKVFYCVVRSGDWVLFNTTVYLKGDKCPEGSDLDLTTGVAMCKPPEPEKPNDCIEGLYDLFSSPPSPVVQVGGRNQVISSPPAGCKNGCAYSADSSKTTSCYFVTGSTNEGFCNYSLRSTGATCPADTNNPGMTGPSLNSTPPTDPNEPPSDPNDPGCPAGYSWSGTTCVKTPTDPTDPTNPGDGGGDGGTGGGGTGGGDGSGEGGGTGGGTGLEGGCKDDSCAFVKNNPFGTDKVPGFDESLQKAWTDIKKAPIGQALGKITFPTGGSCPVQSVELFGKSVMFDSHCSLWAQIEPILKAVFLAFWALLSVRVFLSA